MFLLMFTYLNHFTQPDSIIPDLYNPQSLNRYSYVENRPINFNDPDGHCGPACPALLIGVPIVALAAIMIVANDSSPVVYERADQASRTVGAAIERWQDSFYKRIEKGMDKIKNMKPSGGIDCKESVSNAMWCTIVAGFSIAAGVAIITSGSDKQPEGNFDSDKVKTDLESLPTLTPTPSVTPSPTLDYSCGPRTICPTETPTTTLSPTNTPSPTSTPARLPTPSQRIFEKKLNRLENLIY